MNLEDVLAGWNGCVCSGEGGGCDFSTATVHIVNNTGGSSITGFCPLVGTFDGVTYTVTSFYVEEEEQEQDVTVILYGNNGAALTFTDLSSYTTYTISGNIERLDPDYPNFIVTGDCTVTVSQEQHTEPYSG